MLGNCIFPLPQCIMPFVNIAKERMHTGTHAGSSQLLSTGRLDESNLNEQNFNKASHTLHPPKLIKKKSEQRRAGLWVTISAYTGF